MTMQYYHQIITEKSFKFLQELKKRYRFILIGGWAVFLYSHSLKSKDIDIIIDYSELGKIKEEFDVFKNNRLKKYEIKTGEFDVDIYLPHYSELGVDLEEIKKRTIIKEGFVVPPPEVLVLLKLFAFKERRGSPKGRKDELDIFSLMTLPEFDRNVYKKLVADFNFGSYHALFLDLLKQTTSVKELGLNEQKLAKIKKEISAKI
ncbi:MAG: hypothetical protein COU46_01855 [Candidatus Niyogibacteria bacterium CG10_big_fil_rev_8_21_14_0_10_42_19]|uniref:Nucleotidyl transferase AbiEii/AbiGii toxin family protein n=1 Tax=Candidatus Niyogibacteria bacterium CG10_big_fil_rev_8_21_14_0_10_42_19 TaxID=1974725 RepID=A0A2H0TFP8_9BACT|nr:MAG: hypothetical protein COU46_01855 [Candidatus Niyogibacteria bacterium CG10_big_fil_rev_8_21_14_0_10_42_19]